MNPLAVLTGSGVGEGLGALIGHLAGSGDRRRIRELLDKLDPATAEELMRVAQADEGDPALREEQMNTIHALRSIGDANGMDVQSRVALQEAQDETAQAERASREAIEQGMARRGMANSGASYAAQLVAGQGAATRNAKAGAAAAADARIRALRSMESAGQMAGGVRGQDDAMSRFNASQRMGANQEAWRQRMDKTGLQVGQYRQQEDQTRRLGAGIGAGIGGGAGGAYDEIMERRRRNAGPELLGGPDEWR